MIDQSALAVIKRLNDRGFEAYAVGGCVRDLLLEQPPHDWDVCTNAEPQETLQCFSDHRVIETGLAHGTVTVMVAGEPIEVTTYRQDGKYLDGRHPQNVSFVKNIKEDLSRRDFTVNAMAIDRDGQIVDLFGGKEDLDARLIRCVGDPDTRFEEDALRILRAMRFASVLGFAIEKGTADSIRRNKHRLRLISMERIAAEITKMLMGDNALNILLDFADVLAVPIPEITPMIKFNQHNPYHIFDIWTHTAHAVAACEKDTVLRLTMLFHDIGKPECYSQDQKGIGHFYGHAKKSAAKAEVILKRLKMDNKTIGRVCELVTCHDRRIAANRKSIKKSLSLLGREQFEALLKVQHADDAAKAPHKIKAEEPIRRATEALYAKILSDGECFSLKQLAITGDDLIQLGFQGKQIGQVLQALLDNVIAGKIENARPSLIGKARDILPKS